ncbi:MAG: hypothetical protein ACTSR8_12715 [Promethearchaeota archaeon]
MINKLQSFLSEFFAATDLNLLHENYGGTRYISEPILGVSSGADPIIRKFKEVVAPEHLTPLELWLAEGKNKVSPEDLRVISIIFPYVDRVRKEFKENIVQLSRVKLPAELYSMSRNYTNELKKETCRQTIQFLENEGYSAVAAMLSEAFNILTKGRFYSTWSERHYAFAAGLGTFSLSEALITFAAGCNVRIASVVTDAPLEITPRKTDDPFANCLFYVNGSCRKCADNCPAGAISEEGHNKNKCYLYGQKISRKMNQKIGNLLKPHWRHINGEWKEQNPPVGCAFCQFNVPCMDKNPVK